MSDSNSKIMWRRVGTTMDVKMEYKHSNSKAGGFMLLDESFRPNIFKRFLQWFKFRFLGGIKIVYSKSSFVNGAKYE